MKKKYDWSVIQADYDSGLSYTDLKSKYGMANRSLVEASKRGDLNPRSKRDAAFLCFKSKKEAHRAKKYFDWEAIQQDYDNGLSYRELSQKFKISQNTLTAAAKRGEIKILSNGQALSRRYKNGHLNQRRSTDEFIKLSKKVFGDKFRYDNTNYVCGRTKLVITCETHGDFETWPDNHINKKSGCPKCSNSVSKKEIIFFDLIGISLDNRQVRISSPKRTFVVDAYDPITNTIYEFNGDFWHGNPSKYLHSDYNQVTNCTFGELYMNTVERQNILRELGYNIVYIWESELSDFIRMWNDETRV